MHGNALNTPVNLVKNKNVKMSCREFYGNGLSIFYLLFHDIRMTGYKAFTNLWIFRNVDLFCIVYNKGAKKKRQKVAVDHVDDNFTMIKL